MKESQIPPKSPQKWLRLVARIWSAPIILITFFIALGNLWSSLTNGGTDPNMVEGTTFFDALPPTLIWISAIGLALAWRWETIGGGFSLFFTAAVFIVLFLQGRSAADSISELIPFLLALVILIPGILFLLYGLKTK